MCSFKDFHTVCTGQACQNQIQITKKQEFQKKCSNFSKTCPMATKLLLLHLLLLTLSVNVLEIFYKHIFPDFVFLCDFFRWRKPLLWDVIRADHADQSQKLLCLQLKVLFIASWCKTFYNFTKCPYYFFTYKHSEQKCEKHVFHSIDVTLTRHKPTSWVQKIHPQIIWIMCFSTKKQALKSNQYLLS